MLSSRPVADVDGMALFDVGCRQEPRRGRFSEYAQHPALVLVRCGAFGRTVNGITQVLDATSAYAMNPGDEQRYDHPYGQGDACTYLMLAPPLVRQLTDGQAALPVGPFPVSPALDLAHRRLLARAAREADGQALFEDLLDLAATTLGQRLRAVASRGAAAQARHRALVAAARQALAADHGLTLTDLAAQLMVSPAHLSRVFRAGTGSTLARHRMRLRARAALERLNDGERDLTRLAADLQFADHAHMCRVLRDETHHTPAQLRRLLGEAPCDGAAGGRPAGPRLRRPG